MATRPVYVEIDRAKTKRGCTCNKCGRKIEMGTPYLHLMRNEHVFRVCGVCVMTKALELYKLDPSIKNKVAVELL